MNQDNPYQPPQQAKKAKPRPRRRTRLSAVWVGLIFFVGGMLATSSIDEQTTADVKRLVYVVSGLMSMTGVVIILFAGMMALIRLVSGGRVK